MHVYCLGFPTGHSSFQGHSKIAPKTKSYYETHARYPNIIEKFQQEVGQMAAIKIMHLSCSCTPFIYKKDRF